MELHGAFLALQAAVTEFTSKPSNPFFVMEGQDISLVWSYTLDGSLFFAKFTNVTGGGNDEIGKKSSPGSITPRPNYQARFRAEVSNTQAQLRILSVQISDQGEYELDISATGVGSLEHVVEVIVQCKYLPTTRKVVGVLSGFLLPLRILVGILGDPVRSHKKSSPCHAHCT